MGGVSINQQWHDNAAFDDLTKEAKSGHVKANLTCHMDTKR